MTEIESFKDKSVRSFQSKYFTHDFKPQTKYSLGTNDLSKDSLLEICVGGFTQNNNESLNQLIWKISPKIMSGGVITLELQAYITAVLFNEGSHLLLSL